MWPRTGPSNLEVYSMAQSSPSLVGTTDDCRTNGFLEKYGKLYAVELDALPAIIPRPFRQDMVIDKVEQYFDEDIYQELVDKYNVSDVSELIKNNVALLNAKLNDVD